MDIKTLPLWLRKMAADAIVSFVASVLVMSVINTPEAIANALAVAALTSIGKAAVRYSGDFNAWVREQLGVNDEAA